MSSVRVRRWGSPTGCCGPVQPAGHRRLPGVLPAADRHPGAADPGGERPGGVACAALDNAPNTRNLAYLAVAEKLLDDRVVDVRQVHFYEHFSGVPALLDYLRATTPSGVPMQAWEVGQFWKDGGEDAAARGDEMVKVVSLLVAGGIREVLLAAAGVQPEQPGRREVRYGLLDPDGAERDAGRMLAALADAARDATVTPLPAPVAGRLHRGRVRPGRVEHAGALVGVEQAGDRAGDTGRTDRGGGFPARRGRRRRHGDRRPRVLLRADQPVDRILATVR